MTNLAAGDYQRVVKGSALIGLLMSGAGWIWGSEPVWLGLLIGSALSIANLVLLGQSVQGLVQSVQQESGGRFSATRRMLFKYGGSLVVVYYALREWQVEPAAFLVGLSSTVVATLLYGVRASRGDNTAAE